MAAPLELNRTMLSPELLRQLGESGVEIGAVRDALRPDGKPAPSPPRAYRRYRLRQVAIVATAIALVMARWKATATPTAQDLPEGRYEVAAVKRADLIELTNHVEVQLLGIVAPWDSRIHELEAAAAERSEKALAFTRDFIAEGAVRLQFDRTRLDSHGRYLAYLWVDDAHGGRLLNEELLRAGLVDPSPASLSLCSSSMKRRLTRAAEAGRTNK